MAVLGYLSKLKRSLELAFEEGGGGWGEVRNTKISVSWERKELLDKAKSIFHNCLKAIICWINEN